jgi:outer membrane protein assembly factor BamB
MPLGSETYGNPVVANGKVYVGTNNGSGYISRYPANVDLGVLLCFDEKDGTFLWQHSNEKLPTGRVHDWPDQGICTAPIVDGNRLWYVTNRGEVVCLNTEGFHDGENTGPYQDEPNENKDEADVVWKFNMMTQLGVSQHNMCSCSVTFAGDLLFVCTGNGVDDGHITLPKEDAPSFICLNRHTGEVVWTDNSPGKNVLHGQWSSPAYGVLGGEAQVIFGGGDGWLYSFAAEGENGKAKLLWKFDCNPKGSFYALNRATRNHIIATPVIYDGLVYVGVGEDPEHGEGEGHLWCIDPTKRGDVSPTQVFHIDDPKTPLPHRRLQALIEKEGEIERDNPNSAAVWHYVGNDPEDFEQTMHRTCGTAAIKDGLLFIADFSGLLHCIDAKTGEGYWTYDMFAASWASPLIVGDRVYIGDQDGDIAIFEVSKEMKQLGETNMGSAVYTTPIVANGTMFIANRNRLYAIQDGAQSKIE